MKVQAKGVDKVTNETSSFVLEATGMAQARRFCKSYYSLGSLQLREASEDALIDVDFTLVQQYLSVQQYRKIRSCRGESQFPVLEVLLSA